MKNRHLTRGHFTTLKFFVILVNILFVCRKPFLISYLTTLFTFIYVIFRTDDYLKARIGLRKSEDTSDLSSDKEFGRGARFRNQRKKIVSKSPNDSESDEET